MKILTHFDCRSRKGLSVGLCFSLLGLAGCGTTAGPVPVPVNLKSKVFLKKDNASFREAIRKGDVVVVGTLDGALSCETRWVSGFSSDWSHDPHIALQKKTVTKALQKYGADAIVVSEIRVENTLIVPFFIGAFADKSKGCVRLTGRAVRIKRVPAKL